MKNALESLLAMKQQALVELGQLMLKNDRLHSWVEKKLNECLDEMTYGNEKKAADDMNRVHGFAMQDLMPEKKRLETEIRSKWTEVHRLSEKIDSLMIDIDEEDISLSLLNGHVKGLLSGTQGGDTEENTDQVLEK